MWIARYFLSDFIKFGIYRQIFVKSPASNFMEILPLEAALIQADRQTARRAERWTEGRKGKRTAWIIFRRRQRFYNVADNNTTYFFLHVKCPTFCPVLIEFGFSLQIFPKLPNIRFHRNTPSLSRAGKWRQTDGHDEGYTRFSRLYANASKRATRCCCLGTNNGCVLWESQETDGLI